MPPSQCTQRLRPGRQTHLRHDVTAVLRFGHHAARSSRTAHMLHEKLLLQPGLHP